jgi:hypothetical protein
MRLASCDRLRALGAGHLCAGDLANMDKLDPEQKAKLPTLQALRDAFYSKEFREFVSQVTGARRAGAWPVQHNLLWLCPPSLVHY